MYGTVNEPSPLICAQGCQSLTTLEGLSEGSATPPRVPSHSALRGLSGAHSWLHHARLLPPPQQIWPVRGQRPDAGVCGRYLGAFFDYAMCARLQVPPAPAASAAAPRVRA